MKRVLLASLSAVPLVACYAGERRASGECPAGETCSDVTPRGLDFVGNSLVNDILWSGPRPTAIGGTQVVALEYDRGDGVDVALDVPYSADDDGGIGVRVEGTSGSQVTIRGMGSRSNYLRILDSDGLLMDRKELTGAALTSMELVSVDFESVPYDRLVAFNIGQHDVGVALYGDVQTSSGPAPQRLVDTSMQLTLAGATRLSWDKLRINYTTPGTHSIAVTAGDKPTAMLDMIVVDHADTVLSLQDNPAGIIPNQTATLCFEALAGQRYIIGLTWEFNVDGTIVTHDDGDIQRNCVSVTTTKTSGNVNVIASAGGQSASYSLLVGAMARSAGDGPTRKPLPTAIPTAGDRASM
jgi:hypothetical protein